MTTFLKLCRYVATVWLLTAGASTMAQEGQVLLPAESWQQLKTLTGIKTADNPGAIVQMVVLFDANCPHCAELWTQMYGKDSKYRGLVTLWAPVAYMGKDSLGKAASLLRANTVQALAQNFDNFDMGRRSGGASPLDVTAPLRASIDRNSSAWRKIMAATPLMIYRTSSGQVLAQVGLPPDARLRALLDGLPSGRLENFSQ